MTRASPAPAACGCAHCRQRARESADRFETVVPGNSRPGHELLTAEAARRAKLPTHLRAALIDGVIRPDRGGRSHWNFIWAAPAALLPGTQAAHALRPTRWSSWRSALGAIQRHFVDLYHRAMAAPRFSPRAFEWVGEALHLLQDSYSLAHVERTPAPNPAARGPFRITYIRNFGPTGGRREHVFPRDPRDFVGPTGAFTAEARVAITASAEFLGLVIKHMRAPGGPSNAAELRAFVARHLS